MLPHMPSHIEDDDDQDNINLKYHTLYLYYMRAKHLLLTFQEHHQYQITAYNAQLDFLKSSNQVLLKELKQMTEQVATFQKQHNQPHHCCHYPPPEKLPSSSQQPQSEVSWDLFAKLIMSESFPPPLSTSVPSSLVETCNPPTLIETAVALEHSPIQTTTTPPLIAATSTNTVPATSLSSYIDPALTPSATVIDTVPKKRKLESDVSLTPDGSQRASDDLSTTIKRQKMNNDAPNDEKSNDTAQIAPQLPDLTCQI